MTSLDYLKEGSGLRFLFCAPTCLQSSLRLITPSQAKRTTRVEVCLWKRSLLAAYFVGVEQVQGFIRGDMEGWFEVEFGVWGGVGGGGGGRGGVGVGVGGWGGCE
jgi:hypothetical protein